MAGRMIMVSSPWPQDQRRCCLSCDWAFSFQFSFTVWRLIAFFLSPAKRGIELGPKNAPSAVALGGGAIAKALPIPHHSSLLCDNVSVLRSRPTLL